MDREEEKELKGYEREPYVIWKANSYQGDIEDFRNQYHGDYSRSEDPETAYAKEYAEEVMEIPEYLESYIDYKKLAYDLFIGDFWSEDGHVFSER